MKKIGLGILVLTLVIGFSAFAVMNKKTITPAKDPTFIWHKYNPAGTTELSPAVTYTGTAAAAKVAFGCPDGQAAICARAYDSDGLPLDQYIRKTAQ